MGLRGGCIVPVDGDEMGVETAAKISVIGK